MGRDTRQILIITTNSFPIGFAATNRILCYGLGFVHHGYFPEVICIRPTESYSSVYNNQTAGIYKGIKYSYPGGTTIRVKSFWIRRLNDLMGVICSIHLLIKSIQKKKVSFCIFYGNSVFTEILFLWIAKFFGIKIFKEESENPNVYFGLKKAISGRLKKWIVINKLYGYYDGVLVMTRPLHDFFIETGVADSKILIVPQTVDLDRFDNDRLHSKFDFDYIGYVGSLSQSKDGVLTLIESFKNVLLKYPDIKLVIAGNGTSKERSDILSLITSNHIEDMVLLIGVISSDEIPSFLKNAKILVSCRPQSLQSDYGFPTKVVEYLASGKPLVTTATGDLVLFLKDRQNAFIGKSSDQSDFSFKILQVLQDYNFATRVAQSGKDLVLKEFNPIIQTHRIIDYINLID
jgi:glycosyltransferase involved in cell wall biosynthesis